MRAFWDFEGDQSRWVANSLPLVTSPMPGVLWTHTPGPGDPADPPDPEDLEFFPAGMRDLTSHYWSGLVADPFTAVPPLSCFFYLGSFGGSPGVCPTCVAGSTPSPAITLPGAGPCLGDVPEDPGVIFPENVLDITALFGPVNPVPDWMHDVPEPKYPWVSAAELRSHISGPAPVHAQMNDDGTSLERLLSIDASGAYLDGCPPSGCDGLLVRAGGVTSRVGYALTLSANRNTLWFGGGLDGSENPRGDVWKINLSSLEAEPFSMTGLSLDHVVALHYSGVHDVVYVLDRFEESKYLLYRVPAEGGALEVLQSWDLSDLDAEIALTTDHEGFVHISTNLEEGHCVVRMDHTFTLQDFSKNSGHLVTRSVRANAQGVSAVVFGESYPTAVTSLTNFVNFTSGALSSCF